MKEVITQSAVKKEESGKNEVEYSSNPKIISVSCSKCSKILSCEDAYVVDSGRRVMNWRFHESPLLLFYCNDCLKAIDGKP